MLRTLRIRNLAVIEAVEVDLDPGFTALTGETGAGKSILVEAVGLLLGGRASADLVRTGDRRRDHRGASSNGRTAARSLIRREITAAGRSRSFVDGALATAGMLREVSADLVELHGQHEHQSLLDPSTHLGFLDADAGLETEAAGRRRVVGAGSRAAGSGWRARRWTPASAQARLELVRFQLGEIDAVEAGGWRGRRARGHAARAGQRRARRSGLCRGATTSCTTTSARRSRSSPASGRRSRSWRRSTRRSLRTSRPERRSRRSSRISPSFLRAYADGVDASPARLQEVEDRLARLERLKRKYGPALADVVARGAALRAEVARLTGVGRARPATSNGSWRRRPPLTAPRPATCRERGATAAGPFARSLKALLADLAMAEHALRRPLRVERERARPLGRAAGRPRGVLRVAEHRRGPAAARARSPRAASCRASCSPSGRTDRGGLRGRSPARRRRPQDPDLRRGGRRDRRAGGGGGRGAAARARRPLSGAVHHAPGADRRPGDTPVRGGEAGGRRHGR